MGYRILIADDEAMLVDILSAHLEREGYAVTLAKNSQEVLDELGTRPDLILLDINMPGMDGLELN